MIVKIVYEDDYYVAVDKPSGLLVHRTCFLRKAEALVQILRDQIGLRVYPVHRLDRSTSGIIVFAKSSEAAGYLSECFRNREVQKEYLAVSRGFLDPEGIIDYPLKDDPQKEPQSAITTYKRLATVELPIPVGPYNTARYSLASVIPRTGRTHQIRRHFRHIAHPLVGDTTYGEGRQNRLFRSHFDIHRLLLIAKKISFFHHYLNRIISLEVSPDEQITELFNKFGWQC